MWKNEAEAREQIKAMVADCEGLINWLRREKKL